jgi:Fe2+ or Zn2+ uptake regulation protein
MVRLAGGGAHYDAIIQEHDHFMCEKCGAVSDLEVTTRKRQTAGLERLCYVVRWQTTAIYGLCLECSSVDPESAGVAE